MPFQVYVVIVFIQSSIEFMNRIVLNSCTCAFFGVDSLKASRMYGKVCPFLAICFFQCFLYKICIAIDPFSILVLFFPVLLLLKRLFLFILVLFLLFAFNFITIEKAFLFIALHSCIWLAFRISCAFRFHTCTFFSILSLSRQNKLAFFFQCFHHHHHFDLPEQNLRWPEDFECKTKLACSFMHIVCMHSNVSAKASVMLMNNNSFILQKTHEKISSVHLIACSLIIEIRANQINRLS